MAITKVGIWNAFRTRNGYRKVAIPEAKALIGPSALRYWIKNRWLGEVQIGDVLSVQLTETGVPHLESGVQKHLENHPEDREGLRFFPRRLEVPLVFVEYV